MTDRALKMAEGDLNVKPHAAERRDDLGLLSRSMITMALNISHRIKTMQTMNRIDRAVLSSVSRQELMYKVSGFISDQFGKSEISILERIEGGYRIMAIAPPTEDLVDKIIPDTQIPEQILKYSETPFTIADADRVRPLAFRKEPDKKEFQHSPLSG